MADPRSGDSPRTDPEPALVDTTDQDGLGAEGDEVRTEQDPALVEVPVEVRPTASELRKAGYVVPDDVKAKDVPTAYQADTPTPPGEVRLVEHTSEADDGLTPMERYNAPEPAPEPEPQPDPEPAPDPEPQ